MNFNKSRESNFEINLLPVISLLAVCISFLLLTTVWIHIGTVDVKQAIGEPQQSQSTKEPQALWVSLFPDKKMVISVKGEGINKNIKKVLNPQNQDFDWNSLNQFAAKVKSHFPSLNSALILPSQTTKYKDMIKTIDELKKLQLADVGVAPL